MATVNSSQTRLASIAETTWGTTPSTPTFLIQRYVSESLSPNIETVTSSEIRSDRNVADLAQVGSSAGGTVDIEMTYGSFDTWLESLMYSTWSTNVLKNGSTEKSLTIEKTFEGGATDYYHRFTGSIANSLSLNLAVGQIATGSFDFVSKGMTAATSAIASSSYTAVNSNPVMNCASNFASLSMSGVTGPELTKLDLNITNNLRQQKVIGSIDSRAIGTGRFEVTGSLTAYFENEELFNLFLNGTAADLLFSLGGSSSLKYAFELGTIKFTDGKVITPGNDQDIMVEMSFRGLYDSSDAATLKITRTP